MIQALVIFLLLLLTVAPGQAEEITRLSLKEAVSLSLERNNLIRAARHSSDAYRKGIAIAVSGYYPSIFFEETFSASNSPIRTFMMKLDQGRLTQNDFIISNLNNPSTSQDFRTAISIEQPIFAPEVSARKEIALRESEVGESDLESARQDTAFRVFQLYLEVQKGATRLESAEHALAEAKESLRLAVVREEAGVGLKSDELRARTHLSLMEQQKITAANNLQLARMQLAIAVGEKPGEVVDISGNALMSQEMGLKELQDKALDLRSDMKKAIKELEKAEGGRKLARSAYMPTLGAFASYQLNDRSTPFGIDHDAWLAGVSLRWQIFDGLRRYAERDRTASLGMAAAEVVEAKKKEILYQVNESWLRYQEMGKRLEVARNALKDAEETVRLVSRRFENSLSSMIELLDAQTALNQARALLADAEAGHALAAGRIHHTAGAFVKEATKREIP